jgi:hypothetical protein
MRHFAYSARLTKQGGPTVDLAEVDPKDLPDGVATYPTRGEAKAAWKARQRTRRTRPMTHEQISDIISQAATRPTGKIQAIFAFCGLVVSDTNVISDSLTSWDVTDRDGVQWRVHTGIGSNDMTPNERVLERE